MADNEYKKGKLPRLTTKNYEKWFTLLETEIALREGDHMLFKTKAKWVLLRLDDTKD